MPCQGTDGKVQSKDLAAVDISDQIFAGALSSAQRTWLPGPGCDGPM